jgi:hypothetical protein
LKRDDRRLLTPSFQRLTREARCVAHLLEDHWPVEFVEAAS